jgi:murein DD-endopeptidase MepM/ murein hydrolase activator NlpD
MIRLRHANGYESMYMHLSRMFVRTGQRVGQGQRIGLVGATGLATGPHLDFRLRRDGRFVNFERFRPPRATKLTAQQMETFAPERDRWAAQMDAGQRTLSTLVAAGAQPSPTPSAN